MSTYQKTVTRKVNLSAIGGLGTCFTWTPLGDTISSWAITAGGEVTHSGKMPDWRRRIARGQSATTTFIANNIEVTESQGFCESWRYCNRSPPADRWGIETISGHLNDGFSDVTVPPSPSTSLDPEVDAQARQAFISRARSAQGALRGSTIMAELADTLRTIRNPARGLRSSVDEYSSVARRRISRAIGRDPRGVRVRDLSNKQSNAAQRALSESWLEAQFGWLPLISDIGDGVKAYNQFSDRLETDGISAKSEAAETSISFHGSTHRNLEIRTEVHTRTEQEVRYYGAVKLTTGSFRAELQEEAGFRVRDFAPALWEWIPYSFLVDYFSNIGDIVEAASFPRSDMAWSARTYRNMIVRDGSRMTVRILSSLPYPSTNHTVLKAWFPSSLIIRRKYVHRIDYTGSFVPSLQLEIPGGRNFKKYLNIAALARLRGMRR